MKHPGLILLLISILFFPSCGGFRQFDKEEAVKFTLNEEGQVVMGEENWTGPDDCSAIAFMNETNRGLLITIFVDDDSVRTGAPQAYMNDGVELYFDFRPPRLRDRNTYEEGVVQAIILPEPGKKQTAPVTWYPNTYESEIRGTSAYTELTDSGYLVQVTLPYSGIRSNHFWPRTKFYMDIAINDADTGRRETQLMWAGEADNWMHPHNFEAVIFRREERSRQKKPNILFIFTDQQTLKAMSAYGNKYLRTPNMDDLAEFGVRFTRSYCTSPISSPSRSSLITGRMPHETGVNYNGQSIKKGIPNMGELFRKAGYKTLWAGKWHLPENYPHTSQDEIPGFELLDFLDEENMSGLGEVTDGPLSDAVSKHIRRRIRQPFLLVASFHNPHDICYLPVNPEAYPYPVNMESAPPLPDNFAINPNEPEFVTKLRYREYYGNEIAYTHDFSREDWRNYLYHYYRLTEKVDMEIGAILASLEKEGLDENTLIVFTSDHGDGAASHQWAAKLSLYGESVRIPLIFTWFGETPANVSDNTHLVSGMDVLPTMLDYAGIEIPGEMTGKSLKPVIENPDSTIRDFIVTELAPDPRDTTSLGRMITNGRYKYMLYSHGARNEQLFDLVNDPGETHNLAFNPSYRQIKNILREALEEWMKETNDYFKVRKQD